MPNWVINKITITPNDDRLESGKKQMEKFKKRHLNENYFSFESIIPMPKELDIDWGLLQQTIIDNSDCSDEFLNQLSVKFGIPMDELKKIAETIKHNIDCFGFGYWYNWRIENWGCKWDCNSDEIEITEYEINISFQTPWSCPLPIYQKLTRMYPDLVFFIQYADEDLGSNCGEIEGINGEVYIDYKDDIDFAKELWNWGDEDDEWDIDEDEEVETEE